MTLAHVRLALLALAGLATGAMAALAVLPQARQRLLPDPGVKVRGEALIGGSFALTDLTGRRVTDADFRGRTLLVLFGSTSYHGATSSALQVLSAALDKLGPKAERLVPILIAVDPDRDTPERLQRYVEGFHAGIVVLTGTPEQIAGVLRAYRVQSVRTNENTMMPPTLIYVMGPDGRYRGHLNFAAGADAVAASLEGML